MNAAYYMMIDGLDRDQIAELHAELDEPPAPRKRHDPARHVPFDADTLALMQRMNT